MWFQVDPRSSTPIYQQVVDGIKAAIAKGLLQSGDKVPSVRELATLMTLNHNTVAKGYQELERAHVIEVVRGRGTFVASPGPPPDRGRRIETMKEAMVQMMIEAHHLQLTDHELLEMFQEVQARWRRDRGGNGDE
ncbi:GntR family transcriptional regulator [Sulfobacillus harzensis]|uniref:GntR family transcriptional regulator n=1 Tax=Sulfobacillus harzensis TaxID=2729629 RepID=A0A7Y0Q0Y3_9FIRM|nr:GntR family transcriptional regulator [Sulfobacillus harzensis]NMP20897.1 GntR family transcriptional regulator [Sulfobacillus harzensis]